SLQTQLGDFGQGCIRVLGSAITSPMGMLIATRTIVIIILIDMMQLLFSASGHFGTAPPTPETLIVDSIRTGPCCGHN
ncbi:MAG: hypothetical protein VX886_07195, partial [Pseudomonadota bacterium]|nr:hypothetical protein [Pseudomonadota bacterium]